MKILLAGTSNFSILTFTKIIENFEVVGLIAQPNRPVGRKKIVTEPPTVILGKYHKIKIFQPEKINDIFEDLKTLDFDVLITMAYGQIIPDKILKLAKKGSYNIHGSLLPKYRGAAPIQYALNNGDTESGITFMEMITKMDAGDIIFQEKIKIEFDDNLDSMLEKLSILSSNYIIDWLNKIANNNFQKKPQEESLVTFAPKITREDEQIIFDTMDRTINKIRSLSSTPGAYVLLKPNNQRMKIFRATKQEIKNAPKIKCSDGFIYASEFQLAGKRKVFLK